MLKRKKIPDRLPFWARFLLRFLVAEEDYDQFCGDLEEAYIRKKFMDGKYSALDFLFKQVFTSLPNFVFTKIYWGVVMFKSYLKIAVRSFNRSRLFSLINIAGLSVGIALVLYLLLFVDHHISFDRFHKDVERIYKVGMVTKSESGTRWDGANMGPMGEVLRNDYPQIEEAARLAVTFEPALRFGDRSFKGHLAMYTESSFFRIMSFPIVEGENLNPLERKNTAILTRSLSKKLFENESPIGKMIEVNQREMEVTAIIEDYPTNTDYNIDLYCSFRNTEDFGWFGWNLLSRGTLTYIKLKEGADYKEVEKLIADIPAEHCSEEMAQKKMEVTNYLIPFVDDHLYSWSSGQREGTKALTYVYILSFIGLLILLIACVNFMNLSTARSALRSKEVGLRKVIGANKTQLIKQFLGESFIAVTISTIIGLMFLYLITPELNQLTAVGINASNIWKPDIILLLVAITFITGIVSGLYPAFYLSGFSPTSILKGNNTPKSGASGIRRILVVFQFVITVSLIIMTLVMFEQVDFMKSQYLGFDKEQKVILELNDWGLITENFETVKNEFTNHPSVTKASAGSGIPGVFVNRLYIEVEKDNSRLGHGPRCLRCDYDFIDLVDVELLAGRFFEKERVTDPQSSGLVITESTSKMFGFVTPRDAVGEIVFIGGDDPSEIIGVTKDFHWVGLQSEIEPLCMRFAPSLFKYITLELNSENVFETMGFIESKYAELFPGNVIEYMFVDENFDALYREEDRLISLFGTISIIGIAIACLGLFGLAAFVAERKTKEIGIRKILGASVKGILLKLTKEFAVWVLVANVIAWPIAYYLIDYWLQDFAYRISIGLDVFLIAMLIAFVIAVGTVITQTFKAALSNPIDSIKYE